MDAFRSIRKLQAAYGRAQVLFDVSIDVRAGEVVTLLGHNGMGRSTTIKCLFGMLAGSAGGIWIGGRQVRGEPSHRFARMGMALVPEGRQIFSQSTVEENLVATARASAHGVRSWTLARVYEFFPRLKERRGNLGWQLSGGEQQMLAIGRALMTNPRLLVLDEATEGLAPVIREEIRRTPARRRARACRRSSSTRTSASCWDWRTATTCWEKGRIVWSGGSPSLRQQPDIVHQYLGV